MVKVLQFSTVDVYFIHVCYLCTESLDSPSVSLCIVIYCWKEDLSYLLKTDSHLTAPRGAVVIKTLSVFTVSNKSLVAILRRIGLHQDLLLLLPFISQWRTGSQSIHARPSYLLLFSTAPSSYYLSLSLILSSCFSSPSISFALYFSERTFL